MKATMLNGLPVTMLNGLGCNCDKNLLLNGIGAVANFDIITIGGKRYSVNQILDKYLIAAKPTPVYSSGFDNSKPKYTVNTNQPIGKVTSYLLPKPGRSSTWLEVQTNAGYFYVKNESIGGAVTTLKEQGAITVSEEIKAEKEKAEREDNPVGYYLKKYGLPALLIGGGIYLAATYGKEIIRAKLT
jgi:hypothetical protein